MKGFEYENQFHKKLNKNTRKINLSKEQILRKAVLFHSQGNISEAAKYYQYFINKGFADAKVFSNFGVLLKGLGKLKEAEFYIRKAIELNPNYAFAHSNLGGILKDLGKLKEAEFFIRRGIEINQNDSTGYYNLGIILQELSKSKEAEIAYRKAIEIKPNYADAYYNLGILLTNLGKLEESKLSFCKVIDINPNYIKAYYSLSLFKNSVDNKVWEKQLFSKSFLNHKSKDDQIDIYFARANILHKEKNYGDSSKFLKLGNQLKLLLRPSNCDALINKSKSLFIESVKKQINQKRYTKSQESIFIVGMPRSGSTLLESILTMNTSVYDLGESEILQESFEDYKESNQELNLADIYWEKIKDLSKQKIKSTNKNLYNYLYAGIIVNKIPNSKIIHCFRNPLDNILSIYRTHFARGNEYSSSLIDCANVYLNQEDIMSNYKTRFRSQIYDFNYDLLVHKPKEEIKSLISWLGWDWSDAYLSPHLNPRTVSTASKVQVRSPINSKSIGGWKNYRDLLKPAMEIITQKDKYRDLKY